MHRPKSLGIPFPSSRSSTGTLDTLPSTGPQVSKRLQRLTGQLVRGYGSPPTCVGREGTGVRAKRVDTPPVLFRIRTVTILANPFVTKQYVLRQPVLGREFFLPRVDGSVTRLEDT